MKIFTLCRIKIRPIIRKFFSYVGTSLYEGIFLSFSFYIPSNYIIKLLYFIMHINNISIKNQNNSNGTTGVKPRFIPYIFDMLHISQHVQDIIHWHFHDNSFYQFIELNIAIFTVEKPGLHLTNTPYNLIEGFLSESFDSLIDEFFN